MSRVTFAQSSPPPKDDRGTLAWKAREATKAGKKSITIGAPMITVAEIEPLNDALVHTTAVVAELVATATTHDDYRIVTWRKYKILEKLSTQQSSVSSEPLSDDVPQSLLPLKVNEFVMPQYGGTVTIDGVTITTREPEGELPAGRHLMFVLFRSSGSLAVANYGPRGIFWIDNTDSIHARVESDNNWLHSDLQRMNGSLPPLRALSAEIMKAQSRH